MIRQLTACLLFILFSPVLSNAQSGCPGCTINLPSLPADTVYLGSAPDGIAGEPYSGELSFRMPLTTDPVHELDPGTPAGLNIGKITIIALLNVPPGLDWEPNQFEFDPAQQTDGCVRFCGTPLVAGQYEVQVFVTAQVLGINQSTSFPFSFYIAPAVSTTDGFTLLNNSGCGEVTAQFQNNLPANGSTGFSWFWDFGNGQTSTEENPAPVTYSQPGVYEINYEAIVDTSSYKLTTVQITAAGCNDLNLPPISNAAPELYIKIKDPDGNQVFQSQPINNAPIPAAFNVNLTLGPGDYTLEVRDDDLIGSDHCGTVTFNRLSTDTLTDGSLSVLTHIFHPVFSVQSVDSVFVYEIPPPPVLSPPGPVEVCQGDTAILLADYTGGLQWYRDSAALPSATSPALTLTANGTYWVEYTSPDGCTSVSEPVDFFEIPLPAPPAFSANGNWLQVVDTSLLPPGHLLQWYLNGDPIAGANEPVFCNTHPGVNLFSLAVTDITTGCSNDFALGIAFDPDFDCTVSAGEVASVERSLRLFPNPVAEYLHVVFENDQPRPVQIQVLDLTGRPLSTLSFPTAVNRFEESIPVSHLNSGFYFLKINRTGGGGVVRKFVKN